MAAMFSEAALQKVQRHFEPRPVVEASTTKVRFQEAEPSKKRARSADESDDEDDNEEEGAVSAEVEDKTQALIAADLHKEEADRTVFVGNLPTSLDSKAVSLLFQPFGYVESVRLRSVPVAGTKVAEPGNQALVKKICVTKGKLGEQKGSQNAYVVFREVESVQQALTLNNTVHSGRHIRVDTATPTLFTPSRSIFIGNLPFYADEEELREFFVAALKKDADVVEGVRIVRDQETLIGKGIAYLLLRDRDAVMAVLSLPRPVKFREKWELRLNQCAKPKGGTKDLANKRQRTDATDPVLRNKRKVKDAAMRRLKLKKVETKKTFLEKRQKHGKGGGGNKGKKGKGK